MSPSHRIRIYGIVAALSLTLVACASSSTAQPAQDQRPNILYIMVDDGDYNTRRVRAPGNICASIQDSLAPHAPKPVNFFLTSAAPSGKENLAASQPEVLTRMRQLYEEWEGAMLPPIEPYTASPVRADVR